MSDAERRDGGPRRPGLRRAVHAGLHGHLPGAHRAPAGHPGAEGQLAGRDRPGTPEPVARHRASAPWSRCSATRSLGRLSDRTTSASRHAASVDGDRARRVARSASSLVAVAPEHPGRAGRVVRRPAVLQRPARRAWWPCSPTRSRSPSAALVSGVLGVCLPIASVGGTYVVAAVQRQPAGDVPRALRDRRRCSSRRSPSGWTTGGWPSRTGRPGRCASSSSTFYVDPRRNPTSPGRSPSRFLFVTAYAFLVTYQAYFLLEQIGSDEDDVPHQIFLSTLVQSAVVVVASLVGGRLSRPDRAPEGLRAGSPRRSTAWR